MFLVVAVAGCAGVGILGDGQVTVMDPDSRGLRDQLSLRTLPLRAPLSYVKVEKCTYAADLSVFGKERLTRTLTVSVNSIRDRMLVVIATSSGDVSTYLLSKHGAILDMNEIDPWTSERVTLDNFGVQADRALADFRSKFGATGNPVMFNGISAILPEYRLEKLRPGEVGGVVRSHDGAVWAEFRFRGLTTIDSTEAAVFDLVRVKDGTGAVVVGFNVVDLKTMLPLIAIVNAGSKYSIKRISCAPQRDTERP